MHASIPPRGDALDRLLVELRRDGGFDSALVCSDDGLLLACTGEIPEGEELAGVMGLFDEVVARAERDLGVSRVDEMTLLDARRGRLVVRPVHAGGRRFHLVVRLPARAPWRRLTSQATRDLAVALGGAA